MLSNVGLKKLFSRQRFRDSAAMTLILLGPFLAFAYDRHDILASEVCLIALFMLVFGIALSLVLWGNQPITRCAIYTILIVIFIDVQYGFWDWSGKRVSVPIILFSPAF